MIVKKCVSTGKTTLVLSDRELHDLKVLVDGYELSRLYPERQQELRARYEFPSSLGGVSLTYNIGLVREGILDA